MLREKTLVEFLDDLASPSPAPGGGSTAALMGALGASLVSMVCHLTLGKTGYEEVQRLIKDTLATSEKLRRRLTHLIDEDTQAFNKVMAAIRMPKVTVKEKEKRSHALQKAYKEAARVPLEVAQCCNTLWGVIGVVAEKGNKNSITDAGVAGLLAYGGVKGAVLNVKINLGAIKDESFTTKVNKEIMLLEKHAEESYKKIEDLLDL